MTLESRHIHATKEICTDWISPMVPKITPMNYTFGTSLTFSIHKTIFQYHEDEAFQFIISSKKIFLVVRPSAKIRQ